MKVTLKTVTSYEVISQNGESLGTFIKHGDWHGMVDLRRGVESLIVDMPHDFMGWLSPQTSREAVVVKASPTLVESLEKQKPPFPSPAPQPEKC